jgi:hypothetical protein
MGLRVFRGRLPVAQGAATSLSPELITKYGQASKAARFLEIKELFHET